MRVQAGVSKQGAAWSLKSLVLMLVMAIGGTPSVWAASAHHRKDATALHSKAKTSTHAKQSGSSKRSVASRHRRAGASPTKSNRAASSQHTRHSVAATSRAQDSSIAHSADPATFTNSATSSTTTSATRSTKLGDSLSTPVNYVLRNPNAPVEAATETPLDLAAVQPDLLALSSRGHQTDPGTLTLARTALARTSDAAAPSVSVKPSKAGKTPAGKVPASKPVEDVPELIAKAGVVGKKGMRSLAQAGVPQTVVAQMSEALAHDAVLRGSAPEHAAFRVVYEQVASGKAKHKHPELRLAALTIAGKEHRVYRYAVDHDVAYVDGSGRGVMPLDLASPVPGAPITSPFGWRIHPILEIRKFHEGVDFGAPTGTPVRAAEDGVVEDVGLRGNYGNYVRVRHGDQLQTAYAHLDGFARGLHIGSQVHRGQVIAYIGTTGWATGPHLYYEVIVDGEHLDPLRRDLTLPIRLQGAALHRFKLFTDQLAERVKPVVNKDCLLPMCKTSKALG